MTIHTHKTLKTTIKILMSLLLFAIAGQSKSLKTEAKLSPFSDEYFDKIYELPEEQVFKNLHIHCKQKNMLSIAITHEREYE